MTETLEQINSPRPGVRHPAVPAWLRLVRVFQKVDRASSDQLRGKNLSMAQFDVLTRVGASEGLTQQELADSLLVTKGNVCQLLDRMERGGLIVRKQDGRSNRLFLTPEGRTLFDAVVPEHEQLIADLFSTLSSEEQRQLLGFLRTLDRSLAWRCQGSHHSEPEAQ